MKTTLLAVIVTLSLNLSMAKAATATGGFVGFPMGSTNVVGDYCAQNSLALDIFIRWNGPSGQPEFAAVYRSLGTLNFSRMADVEAFYQQQLQILLQRIASSNSPTFDRSALFWLDANTSRADTVFRDVTYLTIPRTYFHLTNVANAYYPPNTSGVKLGFASSVAYKVSNLTWGRISVTNLSSNGCWACDSLINTNDSSVSIAGQTIFIPTAAALSGTNGSFRTKINLTLGKIFQAYDSMGGSSSDGEFPYITSLARTSPSLIEVKASGGEIGRVFQVMSAPSPKGPWAVLGTNQSLSPSKLLSFAVQAPINTNTFFKLQSTNGVPKY